MERKRQKEVGKEKNERRKGRRERGHGGKEMAGRRDSQPLNRVQLPLTRGYNSDL